MLLSMSLAIAGIAAAPQIDPPPFLTAQERWQCTFAWADSSEPVVTFFGVFRSHVEDDFGSSDYSIAQNDTSALVFVFSDIGNTDVAGKTRKWAAITMIDKRTGDFKRTNVDFIMAPQEAKGSCKRY